MFVLVLVCVGRSWRPKTAATATCSFLSTLITSVLQMLLFLPIPSMLNGCDSTTDQMNNYTAAAAALEGGPSEGGGGFESPFYAHTQLQLISTRLGHFKLLLTSYTSQNVLGYSYQRLNAFVCVFQKGGQLGTPSLPNPSFFCQCWLAIRSAGSASRQSGQKLAQTQSSRYESLFCFAGRANGAGKKKNLQRNSPEREGVIKTVKKTKTGLEIDWHSWNMSAKNSKF